MPANTIIPGFVWAVVVDNKDPEGTGRVKVRVKDLWDNEHSEWAFPVGWPGAGNSGNRGSKYNVEIGSQVILLFDQGDPSVAPAFLPGHYGAPEGKPIGPGVTVEAHEDPDLDELDYQVIWEDEYFRFFVVTKNDEDRRFEIFEKASGSHIIMNATDGAANKSCTISIKATTSIDIESKGTIKLDAAQVQIQGRVVQRKPGVTTI